MFDPRCQDSEQVLNESELTEASVERLFCRSQLGMRFYFGQARFKCVDPIKHAGMMSRIVANDVKCPNP